ncbi:FAD-binding Berberine family protein [Hibiscus syriacus]|uniref:FAD-binding Berberine family protein n=1 Tax=Hibiscus syriacus TaxID=106335 RepID=A0A6A2ZQG8_HIBSY|nr:FAD-binding Berberine family protein [Hibiscus syriacus]
MNRFWRKHGLQTRIRSGGHDYEGLSFVARVPFVIIDLFNFRSVDIDIENRVAWVQSGAILGEFYYRIAEKSRTLAFPGGVFHSVGVGGYISGGGFGLLFRKHGTAGDNVLDAQFIDVNGRILDRKSMGEDLFGRFEEEAVVVSGSFSRGNCVLFLYRKPHEFNSRREANFIAFFLGTTDELLPLMEQRFPELGLTIQDCTEMSWIESILYNNGIQNQPLEILLNRTYRSPINTPYYKIKSDYVKEPISETGLNGLFSRLTDEVATSTVILFFAYGGIMNRISEDATPFPHRAGNLFKICYNTGWQAEDNINSQRYLEWARTTYDYMSPFVSKSPREAYLNYRDLEIGSNNIDYTDYDQATIWGRKYFKHNFDRLVHVKTQIDPHNFFKHEQSIPPLNR